MLQFDELRTQRRVLFQTARVHLAHLNDHTTHLHGNGLRRRRTWRGTRSRLCLALKRRRSGTALMPKSSICGAIAWFSNSARALVAMRGTLAELVARSTARVAYPPRTLPRLLLRRVEGTFRLRKLFGLRCGGRQRLRRSAWRRRSVRRLLRWRAGQKCGGQRLLPRLLHWQAWRAWRRRGWRQGLQKRGRRLLPRRKRGGRSGGRRIWACRGSCSHAHLDILLEPRVLGHLD
mmetsp:Transcript_1379/g.3993  ORF Transcript_1379/g.3993 Transcript_1379/m.3993 type:complete len:233 (+) Transcript_1379:405-1103(+)